jgi:hypothetical protein
MSHVSLLSLAPHITTTRVIIADYEPDRVEEPTPSDIS